MYEDMLCISRDANLNVPIFKQCQFVCHFNFFCTPRYAWIAPGLWGLMNGLIKSILMPATGYKSKISEYKFNCLGNNMKMKEMERSVWVWDEE